MTIPRSNQIDLSVTPYYHCMARCVRRSYLYGIDSYSGRDYSHRKQWIVDRIKQLSQIFCIDIAAYAVMSNHYHLVLHVDTNTCRALSIEDLLNRWGQIYPNNTKELREKFSNLAKEAAESLKNTFRSFFTDISRFMSCLNEHIARKSNKEDDVKGRFWEGRFKSQALLDEGAILTAMAYVDLNPVRAGLAKTPEESEYTSIYERIKQFTRQSRLKKSNQSNSPPECLMPFMDNRSDKNTIDFELKDYLELVDQTGRILRDDKPGRIPESFAPILDRLNLSPKGWLKMVKGIEKSFYYAVGHAENIRQFVPGYQFRDGKNLKIAEQCYIRNHV